MPRIVDAHVHLWDPRLIRYPWLDDKPLLNRPYLVSDYRAATGSQDVEFMIFVQCEAEKSAAEREIKWVCEQAKTDRRIRGLVGFAPLEKGHAVCADVEALMRYRLLRGIRRIIQYESDARFCLERNFLDGVRALSLYDLTFDICVDYRQMDFVVQFAEQIPNVPMILDHIGKPAIGKGEMHSWAKALRELARYPHVACKISGVATEADHRHWTPGQLEPYIGTAIEAFGFDRVVFGSDWPVSTQAIRYGQWVALLEKLLSGVSPSDLQKFWRDNAIRFYRLDEPGADD